MIAFQSSELVSSIKSLALQATCYKQPIIEVTTCYALNTVVKEGLSANRAAETHIVP